MRPDLDDFDDINDAQDEAPRSRAMSWMVLVVAVTGFAALAHYAYRSSTQPSSDADMLVVQADNSPIKQAPVDPEGEKFPNKDKTIYDVIAPSTGEQKVEKLLPEPERAVASNSSDYAGDADTQTSSPPTTTYVKPTETSAAPEASKPAVTPAPSASAPTMINEKPAAKPAPTEVKDVPVASAKETKTVTTAKPAAKPVAAKPAASGDYKVQLGALKSEEEAQAVWKKITAKFGDTIKGSPIIIPVESNGATLYRLRAGGFASADAAKAACAKLAAGKQACILAGK